MCNLLPCDDLAVEEKQIGQGAAARVNTAQVRRVRVCHHRGRNTVETVNQAKIARANQVPQQPLEHVHMAVSRVSHVFAQLVDNKGNIRVSSGSAGAISNFERGGKKKRSKHRSSRSLAKMERSTRTLKLQHSTSYNVIPRSITKQGIERPWYDDNCCIAAAKGLILQNSRLVLSLSAIVSKTKNYAHKGIKKYIYICIYTF